MSNARQPRPAARTILPPFAPTTETARLALDTLYQRPVKGIPAWFINPMEHAHIERLAGAGPGDYKRDPHKVYLRALVNVGVCAIDQFIPENPLSMGGHGYEGAKKGATTGAEEIVRDGMVIDSPEAVAEHLERFVFPALERGIRDFDEEARAREIVAKERAIQEEVGPTMLKTGYAFVRFPHLRYGAYGYANYFMAYALYPELMERDFKLQGEAALLNNRAAARAYREGGMPPLYRLDHDMAASRGTLARVESLDKVWFPHFARCIEPLVDEGVRLIWHCDGNLMEMVPRLLDCGLSGFQGFQYEDGMDYERICGMKTRDGEDLIIWAGVSVTTTLPHGKPEDVRRQMRWLVDKGPKAGLFLAASSSIAPGVPWENMEAFVEGLRYYRENGRGGG